MFRVHVDAEVTPIDRAGVHTALRQGRGDTDLKRAPLNIPAFGGHCTIPSRPAVDHREAQTLTLLLIFLGRASLDKVEIVNDFVSRHVSLETHVAMLATIR